MHSISIKYKDGLDENELWHAFYGVLVAMRDNGQIFGQSMMPFAKNRCISATLPTTTEDGYNIRHCLW
jgi:hypothetical protein